MPKKIRELKAMLARAGFVTRGGKGSHSNWIHPARPNLRVTLSGKDGVDASRYHEVKVEKAIREVTR
jgi:predicted RNA binding protein YcfA (HicA-like mRNA interferase family)